VSSFFLAAEGLSRVLEYETDDEIATDTRSTATTCLAGRATPFRKPLMRAAPAMCALRCRLRLLRKRRNAPSNARLTRTLMGVSDQIHLRLCPYVRWTQVLMIL